MAKRLFQSRLFRAWAFASGLFRGAYAPSITGTSVVGTLCGNPRIAVHPRSRPRISCLLRGEPRIAASPKGTP